MKANMKKIILLLIAVSLFFTPLTGIVAYADVETLILGRTETPETYQSIESRTRGQD